MVLDPAIARRQLVEALVGLTGVTVIATAAVTVMVTVVLPVTWLLALAVATTETG
jgi:hypothetical protein